jgi:predicted lipid-binding transport protein (Tim44 family)
MEERTARVGLGMVLTAGSLVLGAAAGGIVSRFTRQPGMGWDQIGHVLGGMMIGALAGMVVAIVLARRLRIPVLRALTIVIALVAGSMVTLVAIRMRQEEARGAADASQPRPTTPKAVTEPGVP